MLVSDGEVFDIAFVFVEGEGVSNGLIEVVERPLSGVAIRASVEVYVDGWAVQSYWVSSYA